MRTKPKTKIRKSIRLFYLASAILILVCSTTYLLKKLTIVEETNIKTREIYSYENKFKYSYNVNLLNNPYIDEETLEMGENVYITDLIESMNMDLNYEYIGSTKEKIDYEYDIKGYIEGTYEKDGENQKIWNKEYVILETQKNTQTAKDIKIDENIDLSLKGQNNLVKQFEQELGMNIEAKYTIVLSIKTNTEVNGEKIENNYKSEISMDLGEKTTKVKGENNKQDKKYISTQIEEKSESNAFGIVASIILDIVALSVLIYVSRKTTSTNHIKNEYRQDLNRILRLCQDKIVQVSTPLDIKNEKIIDVTDFGEIIKVSEELFKPILYWSSK